MRKALPQGETYAKSREKQGKSSVSRIYRSSVQLVQRLDILCKSATDWKELFQAETIGFRQKLRSNCEQLMFTNPKDYGRKAEDLLWRKVYYDVIQWLRQRRKGSDGDVQLESAYRTHLLSASGFYFHLLLKLQQYYAITLDGIVSWTAQESTATTSESDKEVKDWAMRACQRCLISLGDLARYQQEFEYYNKNMKLAERFYLEAFHLNPDLGMPHNQLGTLLGGHNYGCEGVYHYMRCMMSKEKFEGTEGNLLRLFEKNRVVVMGLKELQVDAPVAEKVKRFLVYFVYLQDVLINHESSHSSPEDIGQLCQSVLHDMDVVLCIDKTNPSKENGEKQEATFSLTNGEYVNGQAASADETKNGSVELSGPLMVKLAGVLIMTLMKLKAEGSSEASVATAFTLAFLSQLLQQCISSLEQDPANKKPNSASTNAKLTNGQTNPDQNSFDKDHEQLKKVRQLKKAIKTRRRRQKRRNMSSSFDSGSASDSDTIEMNSDDESDLSEGGVDDLESEDEESDDVYVESDSEEESSLTNSSSSAQTLFSKQEKDHPKEPLTGNSLSEAGKLLTQQIMRDNLMSKNGVAFGKVTHIDASDVSDVETECSVLSWGKRDEFEELAVVRRLLNEKLLPAIKVMTDWLTVNPDIISTCVESSSSLWSKMASLLNLVLPSSEQLKSTATGKSNLWKEIVGQVMDENWQQTYGLPEDVCLYGLDPLMDIHSKMNMYWTRPPKEGRCLETIIRTLSLRNFGFKLSRMKTLKSFSWDESSQQFLGPNQLVEKEKKESELTRHEAVNRRTQVMKTMAHRRMQSEVSKLEKSLQSAPKGSTAYLVPDAPALCSQLHLIRRLITMEKFLMIIPVQVIAALDSLKKYDTGARESIKYLEGEFKKGNRWIRAQKDNETVESSKRRSGRYDDVAVWRFIQVVNCCRYFVNQAGEGLVTLLTGNAMGNPQKGQRKRFAASGTHTTPEVVEFARSCGVNVESLRAFCDKYTSTRSVT